MAGSFQVSLTVWDNEQEDYLAEDALAVFHNGLKNAEKFSKWHHLLFDVSNNDEAEDCFLFLQKLMERRLGNG